MPVAPPVSYPGVYVQEVPSEVHTISAVETATTAFIGLAERGPIDRPVVVNGFADFQNRFGGLWSKSKLGFSVQDFFRNGGSKAVIVRIVSLISTRKNSKDAEDELEKAEIANPKPTDEVLKSLKKKVDEAKAVIPSAATFSLGTLPPDKEPEAARLTQANKAAIEALEKTPNDSALKKAAQDAQRALDKFKAELNKLSLQAKSPGSWGNNLRIRVSYQLEDEFSKKSAARYGVAVTDLFDLLVHDMSTGKTEAWNNLTLVASARQIKSVLEQGSELVQVLGEAPSIGRPDKSDDPKSNEDIWVSATKPDDNGQGSDGDPVTPIDVLGDPAKKTGLYALEGADIFNLLCIPPFAANDADVPSNVWEDALAYCRKRRAVLLVDPPAMWKSKEQATKIGDARRDKLLPAPDNFAALFFPRIVQPNPLRDNQVEEFVPCGTVAGIIARTDGTRGVWKAPAGTEARLRGVTSLSVPLTDAENGELNPLGVNCLRTMPATGHVVWGARTLEGDDRLASQWKYLPVRRTALFIEESLYRGTQWAVFEPNDEPLWAQLRLNIGAFMHGLFRQGAFQGKSPNEAYFVNCDANTTTQADIDRGIVNVVVGFAPLKPAEFVVLSIQQIAGQLPT